MRPRHWFVVLVLFTVGCAAPSYEEVDQEPLAVSENVRHADWRIETDDEISLFAQSWMPSEEPTATLVVVHGLKDHSSRYHDFAQAAVAQGYAVYALDLRGHGHSSGRRVWVRSFEDYVADLELLFDRVQEERPGDDIYLFGHSMGGAVATLYALEGSHDLAGLVLSAPALIRGDDISGGAVFFTRIFSGIAPRLAVLKLENDTFSRDPEVVAATGEDPLVYQDAGPARTASQLIHAMDQIEESMEEIDVPLLVMHGTEDQLTNIEGSRQLNDRATTTDKTLQIYDGLWHDLLHEPENEAITDDILSWLGERTGD